MSVDDVFLKVPPNSLKDEVKIKITLEDVAPYQSLLHHSNITVDDAEIKRVIKLEPPGTVFDPPAYLRFPGISGGHVFVLHGTRNVDGFIDWKDVTDDVSLHQPDINTYEITLSSFCRYATVRSRFNVLGRMLDSLNCRFQTYPVALFKRIPAFQQHFDTCVVFMTDEVYSTAYEKSQAHDLINKKHYKECDSGVVKKMYTDRDLHVDCKVIDSDIKSQTTVRISSSKLNQRGDVFDEFSYIEKPGVAKGLFVISQQQKGEMKHLWTLKFWEVSSF